MGDAAELAPAPAGDERTEQPPAKPAAPPKPSHKAEKGSTTPAKGASADTSKGAPSGTPGKRKVDKNALSVCAGSPKGSQGLSITSARSTCVTTRSHRAGTTVHERRSERLR